MYSIYISVGIRHYKLTAEEIKQVFQTDPDKSISVGEQKINPKGTVVLEKMPYSNLNYTVAEWENMTMDQAFEKGLNFIKQNLKDDMLLKKIINTNGSAWCNIAAYTEDTFKMEINPKIVKEFSDLGVEIYITHYNK